MDVQDVVETQLPRQVVSDIANALHRQTDCLPPDEERRSAPRIPMHKCMAIVPYQPGITAEPVQVWVSDISAGGVGLIYSEAMQPGDKFIIRLPLPNDSELPVLCKVVRCIRVGDNLYSVGSRFIEPLCAATADLTPSNN